MMLLSRYSDKEKVMDMQTYVINNQGCNLQVYAKGKCDTSTSILFLHGGPGSGAKPIMDLPAFQALEKIYHCVYFDQRGCGSSHYDLKKGLTIDDITSDVKVIALDIKKRWKHTQIILWGGSFGGTLASLCMEKFPEIFSGCILSSPAISFTRAQGVGFYERMKASYETRIEGNENGQQPMEPETFFSTPQTKEMIFSTLNPSNSLRHICAMSSWFFSHSFPHLFQEITIPLLVLQGKDDPICPYQYINDILSTHSYPNIEYHLIDHCGHAIFEDQQALFIKYIQAFIQEVIQ